MLKDLLDDVRGYASKLKSDELKDEVSYFIKATATQGLLPKTPISVELGVIGKSTSGIPIPEAGAIIYAGGTDVVDTLRSYVQSKLKDYKTEVRVNGHRILFELPSNLNI